MSKDKKSDDILELKNILTNFVVEQGQFNNEQRTFNKVIEKRINDVESNLEQKIETVESKLEQKIETVESKLEQKIDKVQLYLEDNIAKNTLALFDEQEKMNEKVTEIDHEVINLKSNLYDISLKINPLKAA